MADTRLPASLRVKMVDAVLYPTIYESFYDRPGVAIQQQPGYNRTIVRKPATKPAARCLDKSRPPGMPPKPPPRTRRAARRFTRRPRTAPCASLINPGSSFPS